jgi:diaminohydroxyphosphoribosylaminopyrimidine deaminase/5-amino-6-(5-phosphoribosylamino)uracil reductase
MASTIEENRMHRALELAAQGQGLVEPNPMVGCVLWRGGSMVGEGWHERFGGSHAEIEALQAAGSRASGATMYVTLEPCCHQGKTPPCSEAIIQAGVGRVIVAMADPFPAVSGGGLARLKEAGIDVEVGLLEAQAKSLNAPYLKRVEHGRPWIIAKWAMTLDGKIATPSGDSRWISAEASRSIVHQLRGRVDGIMVGSNTARLDDPLLTARPAGRRIATRIVVDGRATLPIDRQLIRTLDEAPLLVAVGSHAMPDDVARLADAGCDVYRCDGANHEERLRSLLAELGQRGMTNVLVEGGGRLLANLHRIRGVDEVHAFIAPKILGNTAAAPMNGSEIGEVSHHLSRMADIDQLKDVTIRRLGRDVHVHGRLSRHS